MINSQTKILIEVKVLRKLEMNTLELTGNTCIDEKKRNSKKT